MIDTFGFPLASSADATSASACACSLIWVGKYLCLNAPNLQTIVL